ncbi:MAG: hypothetical protein M3A44_13520 [Gammaproteobacteria bacterium]
MAGDSEWLLRTNFERKPSTLYQFGAIDEKTAIKMRLPGNRGAGETKVAQFEKVWRFFDLGKKVTTMIWFNMFHCIGDRFDLFQRGASCTDYYG